MKIQERSKYKYLALTRSTKKFKISWNGIPVFMKKYEPEISLFNNFIPSIVWHVILIVTLGGLFNIFHIGENPLFKKKDKIQDIEFILDKPYKHRPHKAKLSSVDSSSSLAKASNKISKPKNDLVPQNIRAKNSNPEVAKVKHSSTPNDFSIPMPKMNALSSSAGRRGHGNSSSHSSSNSDFVDIGSDNGSANGTGNSKGSGFNKVATRKAVGAYDISPYVNELKRNVRWNWKPAQEKKSVELFLRIAKDGRLVILNVKRTSESAEVDNAALNAVRKTLPLNPLPSKYTKNYLDVVFTFDNSTSLRSRF